MNESFTVLPVQKIPDKRVCELAYIDVRTINVFCTSKLYPCITHPHPLFTRPKQTLLV